MLGLAYLHTGPGTRLYLSGNSLALVQGSGEAIEFENRNDWSSPKLWGAYTPKDGPSIISFRADGKTSRGQSISTSILFDFDGDGEVDRTEIYEGVTMDVDKGFEKFTPPLLHGKGEFQDFRGGKVTVILESLDGKDEPLLLAARAGHLNIPYRELSDDKKL